MLCVSLIPLKLVALTVFLADSWKREHPGSLNHLSLSLTYHSKRRVAIWLDQCQRHPCVDPASLTMEELIAYYSIRGFAVQDIRLLLRYIHGHAIRYLVVHTCSQQVATSTDLCLYSVYNRFSIIICMLLATNFLVWPITFSKRQLIRIRKQLGVNTRRNESELSNIIEAIQVIYSCCYMYMLSRNIMALSFFQSLGWLLNFLLLNMWLATSCPHLYWHSYCTAVIALTAMQ